MDPELSVVIPTHNRRDRLERTIEALLVQTLDEGLFEVIVVDDGSTDGTESLVRRIAETADHRLRYYWQPKQSVSVARNFGVQQARAPVVMMLDNDILVNREHLALHHAIHKRYPQPEVAVLSRIRSAEGQVELLRNERTPNSIGTMPGGESVVDAMRLVTGAISLKKSLFITAGMLTPELDVQEDLDLGYRLQQRGMLLIYCTEALAIHTEPLNSVEKVVSYGKKYGLDFARNYGRVPLYGRDRWRLGGRFDGGWNHLRATPSGYLKDAIRRWLVNRLTIIPMLVVASRLPITDPPTRLLKRLCMEIWAYHYRKEFRIGMRQKLSGDGKGRRLW